MESYERGADGTWVPAAYVSTQDAKALLARLEVLTCLSLLKMSREATKVLRHARRGGQYTFAEQYHQGSMMYVGCWRPLSERENTSALFAYTHLLFVTRTHHLSVALSQKSKGCMGWLFIRRIS